MTDTQSKTAGSGHEGFCALEHGGTFCRACDLAARSHPATQAGALQAVKRDAVSDQARLDYVYRSLRAIADRGRAGLGDSYPEILSLCITIRDMLIVATGPMRFDSSSILGDRALLRLWDSMPNEDVGQWERALAFVHLAREADAKLAATQPNAAPAAEVVAPIPRGALPTLRTVVALLRENGRFEDEEGEPTDALEDLRDWLESLAAPAAAIDAREQEDDTANEWRRLALQFDGHRMSAMGLLKFARATLRGGNKAARDNLLVDIDTFILAPPLSGEEVLAQRIAALASRSESPEARPNAAGQEQGGASAGLVLIGWEYRHLDTANTPNRWSEWERCRARNRHTSTDEDFANEIRAYIKSGFNYEVRELYAATPPLEAVGSSGMTADKEGK